MCCLVQYKIQNFLFFCRPPVDWKRMGVSCVNEYNELLIKYAAKKGPPKNKKNKIFLAQTYISYAHTSYDECTIFKR